MRKLSIESRRSLPRPLLSPPQRARSCLFARQVYVEDGQPRPASIPEQLTLLPAVAVTSMSMPAVRLSGGAVAGGVGGPLGSAFPCKAAAGIHVCLPPGMDYMRGVQAMEAHFAKVGVGGGDRAVAGSCTFVGMNLCPPGACFFCFVLFFLCTLETHWRRIYGRFGLE